MAKQRRALILYATMTKNTEKIARWFQESFEAYKWEVTSIRMKNTMDIDAVQPLVYFDDYDVICLGSPIVAGYPLKAISKHFSLGAHSGLEEKTAETVESGAESYTQEPMGPPPEGGMQMPKELQWRRSGNRGPYPGAIYQHQFKPLGIVFTTYGGGFYGSDECLATLEVLKLYLQLNNVAVVGTVTAGKGKFQKLFTLADGSGVYVSYCRLLAGGTVEYDTVGVTPDFITDAAPDFVLPNETPSTLDDVQLRKAVEVLDSNS